MRKVHLVNGHVDYVYWINTVYVQNNLFVWILFYLNKIAQTELNLIRPFCDDKHFTAAAHFRLNVKLKVNLTVLIICIIFFQFLN